MRADRTQRTRISVEHVRIQCTRPFDDVVAALQAHAPKLDPGLMDDLVAARTDAVAKHRANGPELWLFLTRDHGALIAAEGHSEKALQFEIGNPLTAESMTRHDLRASLYAPLRVALYEDRDGVSFFEYDLPSSLFGQFGNAQVATIGLQLDRELDDLLSAAAG